MPAFASIDLIVYTAREQLNEVQLHIRKILWGEEQRVAEVPAVRSDCGASLPAFPVPYKDEICCMSYDITLCLGQNYPIQQNCYRFTAKIPGRKNFFASVPYQVTTNECEHLIDNRPDEDKIRLKADQIWQQMGCPNGKSLECWLQAEKELM